MQIFFGGGVAPRQRGEAELVGGLQEVLRRLHYTIGNPVDGGVAFSDFVVALVDDASDATWADIQDAIELHKPVLCMTDGRRGELPEFVYTAARAMLADIAHYSSFDELASKVLCYARLVATDASPGHH